MGSEIAVGAPTHGRAPTIRDVAALAGVSISTVSRVLNGGDRVSGSAKERVQDAIDELDYVCSPAARALRPGTASRTWGLLVDEVRSSYFGSLVEELDAAAQRLDCSLLVSTTHKRLDRERRLAREMAVRGVDGLFVVPADGDRGDQVHAELDVPLVYLDRLPRGGIAADVVTFDYAGAVRAMVVDLVERGHRRIAFIGGKVVEDPGSRRLGAFREAMQTAGMEVEEALLSVGHDDADLDVERAYRDARSLLELPDPPTAVVTTFDSLTMQVLRAIRDLGSDTEVAGSEDFPAAFLTPTRLSLVRHDLPTLTSTAVQLLTDRMSGAETGPPTVRMIEVPIAHYAPAGPPVRI